MSRIPFRSEGGGTSDSNDTDETTDSSSGSTGVRDTASRVRDQTESNDRQESSDPFDEGSTGSEVISSGGDETRARSTGSSSGSDDATGTPGRTADDDNDGAVQDADDDRTTSESTGQNQRSADENTANDRSVTDQVKDAADRAFNRAKRAGEQIGRRISREQRQDQRRSSSGERFGDFDYSFGYGDPDVDEVERAVEDLSQDYSEQTSRAIKTRQTGLLTPTDLALDAARVGADIGPADELGYGDEVDQSIDAAERFTEGAVTGLVETGNLPGLAKSGAEAAEFGAFAATEGAKNPEETAGDIAGRAANIGEGLADAAQENPAGFAGTIAGAVGGGAAASVGSGRVAGSLARKGSSRIRTAGGTEVDIRDVTSEDVARFTETDGAEGEQFPSADDPELYREDPARAISEQSQRRTPEEIRRRFDDAGVEGNADLKKALSVEPDGPGKGSAAGFDSAPDEVDVDVDDVTEGTAQSFQESGGGFSYETPGTFFSSDLSTYFLRQGSREMSLRPGLPSVGDKPTGVIARADVENTEAEDLVEFGKRQVEREEATFETKPPSGDEFNTGEIEAVAPPGASFSDIGGSRTRKALRRIGVGADFYTEVDGNRVPIRLVEGDTSPDANDIDTSDFDGGQNRVFSGIDQPSLRRRYSSGGSAAVDRPAPIPFGSGGGSGNTSGSGGESIQLNVDSFGVSQISTDSGGDSDSSGNPPTLSPPSNAGDGGGSDGPGSTPPGGGGGGGSSGNNTPGGGGSPTPSGRSQSGFFGGGDPSGSSSKRPDIGLEGDDEEEDFFKGEFDEVEASFESGIADPEDLLR